MFYKPDYVFDSVADITLQFLEQQGIDAIILDLDNTLTTHNNPIPDEKRLAWFNSLKATGFKMIIVSNNSYERVKPFADVLGLDFVPKGRKPLTIGYNKAVKQLGIDKKHIASVGDQIFTDVIGSKLCGIKSIFTFPIEPETGFWFRVKRTLETPLRPKRRMITGE